MNNKLPIITCPVCGQEYMPGEIFIPKDFFGNQKEIIRGETGNIEFYTGDDMCLVDEYICDSCNTKLKITAKLNFDVEPISDDFYEEYVVKVDKPQKIKLQEENLFI